MNAWTLAGKNHYEYASLGYIAVVGWSEEFQKWAGALWFDGRFVKGFEMVEDLTYAFVLAANLLWDDYEECQRLSELVGI